MGSPLTQAVCPSLTSGGSPFLTWSPPLTSGRQGDPFSNFRWDPLKFGTILYCNLVLSIQRLVSARSTVVNSLNIKKNNLKSCKCVTRLKYYLQGCKCVTRLKYYLQGCQHRRWKSETNHCVRDRWNHL